MFCINLSIHPFTVPSVMCVSILLSRLEELRLIYSFGCCLIQVNFAGLALFFRPNSDHCLPLSLTDWLTETLTHSLMLLRLDWCDPGVWRCQLKTCWCCYCYLCCWWGTCWQLCGRDFDTEDCSRYRGWDLVKILKLKFGQDSEAEVWSWFWGWILANLWHDLIAVILIKARNPWVCCVFNNFYYTTDVSSPSCITMLYLSSSYQVLRWP